MERKFKGIAIMLLGIFICVLCFMGMPYFLMGKALYFIVAVTMSTISVVLESVGMYFVFSVKNNDTEKAIKSYINGQQE